MLNKLKRDLKKWSPVTFLFDLALGSALTYIIAKVSGITWAWWEILLLFSLLLAAISTGILWWREERAKYSQRPMSFYNTDVYAYLCQSSGSLGQQSPSEEEALNRVSQARAVVIGLFGRGAAEEFDSAVGSPAGDWKAHQQRAYRFLDALVARAEKEHSQNSI